MPDWILIQSSNIPQLELYGEPLYAFTISCLLNQVIIPDNYADQRHVGRLDLLLAYIRITQNITHH